MKKSFGARATGRAVVQGCPRFLDVNFGVQLGSSGDQLPRAGVQGCPPFLYVNFATTPCKRSDGSDESRGSSGSYGALLYNETKTISAIVVNIRY
jgi:hypothetical protein